MVQAGPDARLGLQVVAALPPPRRRRAGRTLESAARYPAHLSGRAARLRRSLGVLDVRIEGGEVGHGISRSRPARVSLCDRDWPRGERPFWTGRVEGPRRMAKARARIFHRSIPPWGARWGAPRSQPPTYLAGVSATGARYRDGRVTTKALHFVEAQERCGEGLPVCSEGLLSGR